MQCKKEFHGDINVLSDDYKDVIPDADVIFLCMPVHQYRNALKKLAPFINRSKKEVFIGTIYGQAGFNWMVSSTVLLLFHIICDISSNHILILVCS